MSDQQQYKYTTDEDIKDLDDIKLDTTDDKGMVRLFYPEIFVAIIIIICLYLVHEYINNHHVTQVDSANNSAFMPRALDNVNIVRHPIHAG